MHEKLFAIQIFQSFRQIPPRVCTLVLFIIIIIGNATALGFADPAARGIGAIGLVMMSCYDTP